MKLQKISMENFQGIKNFTFEPSGHNASVYGTNASGKTTLYNSLTWLLFDKASTGEKGFSPKPKGPDGTDLHNLNVRVDGTFILDDGSIITLTKDLHEKWTKKRGSQTEELTGHETTYAIDGVPVTKTEYDNRLALICPPEIAQILTQPEYFPEALSWQNRRKILLDVCGDVTEFDVINSDPELRQLNSFLLKLGSSGQFYSVDEYQKIATVRRKEINAKLEQLPARIDEAAKAIPDITGINEVVVRETIKKMQGQQDEVTAEKLNLLATSSDQLIRQQIAEINTAISEGRARYNEAKNAAMAADREAIARKEFIIRQLENKAQEANKNSGFALRKLEQTKLMREKLVSEYDTIKESVWKGDTVCPTCKQALPKEQIESAKAAFNYNKSNRMEAIRKDIEDQCSKKIIAELEQIMAENNKVEAAALEEILSLETEIKSLKSALAPKEVQTYESTEEYQQYITQISELKAKAEAGNADVYDKVQALQTKINNIQGLIDAEIRKLMLLQAAEQQQKRVEELVGEERQLNREYENLTQGLYLCEKYIVTKVNMLNDKINNKFDSVKFRLFIEQINGGIKEDCEVMIPTTNGLVPFSTANNAARINAGLEIIDTLSRHWGITMPVFVDNAESIVSLRPIAAQVVRLVVSESDPVLRVDIH